MALTIRPAFATFQKVTCERNFMNGEIKLDSEGLDWVKSRHMAYRIVSETDVGDEQRPGRPNWVFGTCLIEAHTPTIPESPLVRGASSTPVLW